MQPLGPIDYSKPLVLLALFLCAACADANQPALISKSTAQAVTTASGLVYEVIETGSGPTAKVGDTALIHETTQLADGTMLVDTWAMNHPIRFLLGGNQVIEGMDEAVTGMRVGERRKFMVPPSLSKRTSYPGDGSFGPNDTLYYNVTLLQIEKPKHTEATDTALSAVYRSQDFGPTWDAFGKGLPVGLRVNFIEMLGNEIIIGTDNYGVFINESNKAEWNQVGLELPGKKINALHVSGGDLFIGVYQKGLYTSKDNGETWTSLNYNLPDLRVRAILKTKDAFWLGTDSGVFKFIDEQKGWKPSYIGGQVNSLSEYEDKIIAGTVSGVFISIDNGEQWDQVGAPGTVHNTAILDGNIIAMHLSGDLFSSQDGGENWNKIDYTSRTNTYVYEMVYAGKHLIMSDDYGIHRSSDWGKTWEHVYEMEEIVFSDFLVIENMIYGGTLR